MNPAWRTFSRTVKVINNVSGHVGGILILVCCVVITNEVIWRYWLHAPHTWNLELNIFLLIASTFLAANYTQMKRGHVGTEVLQTLMPASWNRWRIFFGDVLSLLLCAYLAVKVWQYTAEAWNQGWRTESVWAPHLWIPFSLIGLGLTLLSLEYVVQVVEEVVYGEGKEARDGSE